MPSFVHRFPKKLYQVHRWVRATLEQHPNLGRRQRACMLGQPAPLWRSPLRRAGQGQVREPDSSTIAALTGF